MSRITIILTISDEEYEKTYYDRCQNEVKHSSATYHMQELARQLPYCTDSNSSRMKITVEHKGDVLFSIPINESLVNEFIEELG